MKSEKKSPIKKRDRAATEKALIEAAMQLFASKGFDGTRTLEIAQKAKVNEALIARYFGGKEGLLLAVLKDESASQEFMASRDKKCVEHFWIPDFTKSANLKEALKDFFKAGEGFMKDKAPFI